MNLAFLENNYGLCGSITPISPCLILSGRSSRLGGILVPAEDTTSAAVVVPVNIFLKLSLQVA